MISNSMKHFIYKTTHKNGKYYIGRHSTDDLDDGYIGSGKWPRSIKDKSSLTREIIEFVDTFEELISAEIKYLTEHFGKPNCMNMSNTSKGWATGASNPMQRSEVKSKMQGDNHWTKHDPNYYEKTSEPQKRMVKNGTHNLLGDRNPNKDGRNARQAIKNGTHINLTNNSSIRKSKNGTHQWQNGKSPNYQGKLNKKLIEEGTHNFLGPALNNKRVKDGTHNFTGSAPNLKRLAEGRHPSQQKKTCQHCEKTMSSGMYARWHGNNCKQK